METQPQFQQINFSCKINQKGSNMSISAGPSNNDLRIILPKEQTLFDANFIAKYGHDFVHFLLFVESERLGIKSGTPSSVVNEAYTDRLALGVIPANSPSYIDDDPGIENYMDILVYAGIFNRLKKSSTK